jgi:Uma2 family endonuclease
MLPQRRKAKLTVKDYLVLDYRGAFESYGKTELINGDIFYMNAQHRPHARAKTKLYDSLRDWVRSSGSALTVMIEATVSLPPNSAPVPDLLLTSDPDGDGPVPCESLALVVEIADSTAKSDLTTKASIYAKAGIAEYWVIDLPSKLVHQHWQPGSRGYGEKRAFGFAEAIASMTITGLTVPGLEALQN